MVRGLLLAVLSLAVAGGMVPAASGARSSRAPLLAASPASSSSSPIELGAGSSQTLTITNDGGDSSAALTVALSQSPPSGGFVVTSDRCSGTALGPRKSCSVTISYPGPAAASKQTATLTVTGKKPLASVSSYFLLDTPPVAAPDAFDVTEASGQTYPLVFGSGNVLANDGDPDGDPLAVADPGTVILADGNSLTLHADGTFSYAVNTPINGPDVFRYAVTDGTSTSGSTVTFDVADTAPVAASDTYAATANQALSVDAVDGVLANDTAGGGAALSAVLVSGPAHGSLALNAEGAFTYTPAAGFVGTDSFTYRASDGLLESDVATVTITVADVAPLAVDDAYTAAAGQTLAVGAANGVLANDSAGGGSALSAVLVSGPAHGSLALNADGSFAYTPAPGFVGTDSFTYEASDGVLDSSVATVTITVVHVPPVANADGYGANENRPLTVGAPGILANDTAPGGAALSAVLVSGPAHGSLALNADGSFTYTPAAGFVGTDSFTYEASDGVDASNVAAVTITVTGPVAVDDAYSATANRALSVGPANGVLANDSGGGGLSAVLVSGPAHGSLALNADGSFTYTPAAGFVGTDSFTYEASDGVLVSNVAAVTITVSGPVAVDDLYRTAADQPLSVDAAGGVLANDTGSGLSAVLVSGPAHGSLALNADGSFTYTPSGFVGADSFTYEAAAGSVESNVAAVTIEVG